MSNADSPAGALERARSAVDTLPPSWESTERRRRVLQLSRNCSRIAQPLINSYVPLAKYSREYTQFMRELTKPVSIFGGSHGTGFAYER